MRACKGWSALRQFQMVGLFGHGGGCNGLVLSWLRLGDGKTILFASLVGGEDEHPFHVPSHGHEVPLAPDVVDSSQQKLPEAHDRFDDAKHRFWNLLAQCIKFSSLRCF